ncbi:MAG: beta-ketoacyl-ACP synthase II [Candidatus Dormibacteria bacterium]
MQVVVTGIGCVTPLGLDTGTTWSAMLAGRSGISTISQFDNARTPVTIAGEVRGFDPEGILGRKQARRMARFSQFAVGASEEAVADSGINFETADRDRVGVLVASGIGGLKEIEEATTTLEHEGYRRVSPFVVPMMIGDMASGNVAIRFDLRGPNFGLVSACASGAHAIGEAAHIIRRGDADVMLAGGSEAAITPVAVAAFIAARALCESGNEVPEKASRPFDRARDGFVIAEGAAVLVLESEEHALRRGARVLAYVAGYGASADAYHMTAPDPGGRGAASSMRKALGRAGMAAADVDYVNAHGTSTQLNDRAESSALREVFGEAADSVAVSSTKSMTGHLLGAAGALESVVCIKAIAEGQVPPTINLDEVDPDCNLNHVRTARAQTVRVALNNSFGFGGHNATLVFSGANPDA